MTADLALLMLAFAFMTAGICHLVIAVKRIAAAWLFAKWSEILNQCAGAVR